MLFVQLHSCRRDLHEEYIAVAWYTLLPAMQQLTTLSEVVASVQRSTACCELVSCTSTTACQLQLAAVVVSVPIAQRMRWRCEWCTGGCLAVQMRTM